jgi:hypothetical protein
MEHEEQYYNDGTLKTQKIIHKYTEDKSIIEIKW